MEKLFEIQRIILAQWAEKPFYDRKIFASFAFDNNICGVVGARGIGKTTFLLKYVQDHAGLQRKALYVSADNLYFLENRLLELVDQLYKETDVTLLCIDEIHKYPNWQQELKNITDTYLNFKIIFSGSSQIDLIHGKYDLSRRVTLYPLHGLSFREYCEMTLKLTLPVFKLDQVLEKHIEITNQHNIPDCLKHFNRYLRCGYYPFCEKFSDELEIFQVMNNIVQKIIYEDIGNFHTLKTTSLLLIEKLYQFVLNTAPGELNAYKLSSQLNKDFDSISHYLRYLEQAGLIRFLYPKKSGLAFLRNPTKMYPENTNLIYAAHLPIPLDNMLGKVRETFVMNQLINQGIEVYYPEQGDFQVGEYIFEIGGKTKTDQQIKNIKKSFIFADGILTGSSKRIPLYCLGFLY